MARRKLPFRIRRPLWQVSVQLGPAINLGAPPSAVPELHALRFVMTTEHALRKAILSPRN
jgi:hypothetical protein